VSEETFVPDATETQPRRRAAVAAPKVEAEPVVTEKPKATPSISGLRGGWSAAQQIADSTSPFATFFRPEQSVQILKFLEESPYASFGQHWVERQTQQGQKNLPFTCLSSVGKDCPLCDIGDRASAVSSFNVALVGDDGVPVLRSWNVGVRIMSTLKNYAEDPKIGPLTRGYYAVSKSGRGGGTSQTNIIPIRSDQSLLEDYDVTPPTEEALAQIGTYDTSVIQIPKHSELQDIAEELTASEIS
jgi:hypothetical protein